MASKNFERVDLLSEERRVKLAQFHSEEGKLVTSVIDSETGELLFFTEMDTSEHREVNRMISEIARDDAIKFIYGCGYKLEGESNE